MSQSKPCDVQKCGDERKKDAFLDPRILGAMIAILALGIVMLVYGIFVNVTLIFVGGIVAGIDGLVLWNYVKI